MIKIFRNAEVYAPEYLGKKDVLVLAGKIAEIRDEIKLDTNYALVEEIDCTGNLMFPGFIDNHVHILGGGGEGGYKTRTPELVLSTMIKAGVTTAVGCLGTDGVTRNMKGLVAKAKALKEEGVSCYIYTGSYDVPVRTLMGNIKEDILFVEEIIGVGEIAISDHRSSQPTYEEVIRAAADARVAGMLSGKAGIVNVHLGGGPDKLNILEEIIEKSTVPIAQFLPTHVGRSYALFRAAVNYALKGGMIDFTVSAAGRREEGKYRCSRYVKEALSLGVPIEHITFSSDAQGSLPEFNQQGELIKMGVGNMDHLFSEASDMFISEGIPIEDAVKVITSNPARILRLNNKGRIKEGCDADFVLTDNQDYTINSVVALGKIMMKNKELIIKGTFE